MTKGQRHYEDNTGAVKFCIDNFIISTNEEENTAEISGKIYFKDNRHIKYVKRTLIEFLPDEYAPNLEISNLNCELINDQNKAVYYFKTKTSLV